MELTSPKTIKELLAKYETRPSKGLGQNFLIDKNVLEKIIESAEIKPSDVVLEVGPGIGTLTQKLAERAGKVIAIEKDKKMIEVLKETMSGLKNVEVINADVLSHKLKVTSYKVVANIPYYLTSPLIRKFLEEKNPPQEIVLMVQKEVAKRICSKPPRMSLLSVSVQFYAQPKIISYVSKNCFLPAPKVDSAIIKIVPGGQTSRPTESLVSPDLFFKIVKAGFSQPRKQLVNNLTGLKSLNGVKLTKEKVSQWLLENNIKPSQRAETLDISDWIKLTKFFNI
ncbi:MAG: 16S rRNA (adenine(1518)-N(6)/adenine(1519)-N(6))-dimethyltransferase RsmA [Candidatus Staskawiczbacteria bacterium]|nr:16S rRNA (adenine(1518)-N(6)/adenine(1519)-N(6))-dimethyltransferase RsmA [Candidatus Staskawiczbacteria bacterium]